MRLFTTHDVGSQPDGSDGEPVFRLDIGEGVKVVGLGDTTDFGVVSSVMFVTDDFLYDDGHFLFLDHVVDGVEVCPGFRRVDGGEDELDGVLDILQPMLEVRVVVGEQVGGIDPGKRLIERVLEKPGGTHGQWFGHDLKVLPQVVTQLLGEACSAEGLQNVIIFFVLEDDVVEVVGL